MTTAVTATLGIRFAAAPRLHPPVPADGVAALGRFGPSSLQPQGGYYTMPTPGLEVGDMNEDCLYLNVWAPHAAEGAPFPVMVWIHGGGFHTGGAACPTYDGSRLAAHGVVVVTLNYRLGVLGFHRGNWGLLDMVAALQWVRRHAADFGGDPRRVTVFGESAGASAIIHLLVSPRAAGLFHRAIVQSPGAARLWPAGAEAIAAQVEAVLCTPVPGAPAHVALAAQVEAARLVGGRLGPMPWHPVIDGEVVPDEPLAAIRADRAAPVDVLIGSTAAEIQLFVRPEFDRMTQAELVAPVQRYLESALRIPVDAAQVPSMFEPYDRLEGTSLYVAVCTDQGIRVPVLLLADALAARGSVYSYSFDWAFSVTGASHTVDLPFTFGTVDTGGWERHWTVPVERARAVAQTVMAAWAAFAATGDPSGDRVGRWPRYEPTDRATVHLGHPDGPGVTEAPAVRAARFAPVGYPPG
jgi:para-nitrobenzyl esterase